LPAIIKHTKTAPSWSALLILIVASFSPRSSRYNLATAQTKQGCGIINPQFPPLDPLQRIVSR
jgi:hypothetical protein